MPEDDDIYDGDDEIGYGDAIDSYWQNGWRGILPLVRGHKGGSGARLPSGRTGKAGTDPSRSDIQAWIDLDGRGNDNLCLRLPDTIIGIDVDHYGAKNGGLTIAEAEKRWGKLPKTSRTTSRQDGISGIRFFRVPAGTRLIESINFSDLGLGDVEIVQHTHRYAVAWPSIHPEGRPYWWLNDNNQIVGIPNIDDIPPLPEKWLRALTAPAASLGPIPVAEGAEYDVAQALTKGEMSEQVSARLNQAITELNTPGICHHDSARKTTLSILRLGKNGQPGVDTALAILMPVFVSHTAQNRAGGAEEARREFRNLIFGPGAIRELSQPSHDDWIRELVKETAEQTKNEIAAQTTRSENKDVPAVAEPAEIPNIQQTPATPPAESGPTENLQDIEQGFWDSRQSLKEIYESALAAMASPWAVLAISMSRALCLIPPRIKLPAVLGRGGGSLNQFFAVVAKSSGGKGLAAQVARELVPESINVRAIGTGEGFLAAFNPDAKDPSTWLEAIYFDVPEVDQLKNLAGRSGNDVLSILRQAWSGEFIGYGYADATKRRSRDEHTYRMTMTVSMQPKRAGWLLSDEGGGTPQRFMWFPAKDTRITVAASDENKWLVPLRLAPMASFMYPRTLTIPKVAKDLIKQTREENAHELIEALDGHALFARVKFAYGLAFIDGRDEMNEEDWQLSGIAAAVSSNTRALVVDELHRESMRVAEEAGSVRGVEQWAADIEKKDQREKQAERVTEFAIKRLSEKPMGIRDLKKSFHSRDRGVVDDVVATLTQAGAIEWIEVDGKRLLAAVK